MSLKDRISITRIARAAALPLRPQVPERHKNSGLKRRPVDLRFLVLNNHLRRHCLKERGSVVLTTTTQRVVAPELARVVSTDGHSTPIWLVSDLGVIHSLAFHAEHSLLQDRSPELRGQEPQRPSDSARAGKRCRCHP